jgi:hypothetical protein
VIPETLTAWELLILLDGDLSNWVGVVLFSNFLPISYPQVGGDGPSYTWGLGSFLRLPGRCGTGFFLGPGDVRICLDFQLPEVPFKPV